MSRKELILRSIATTLGSVISAFGISLTIKANFGVSPWDVLSFGLSKSVFHCSYGTATVIVSATILCISLLMREKIGIGTLTDTFITGKVIDFFLRSDLVPYIENNFVVSVLLMALGFLILGYSQWIKMTVALSCGPRGCLPLALGRRLQNFPVSFALFLIMLAALIVGWILGGPVGWGTLFSPFLASGMQWVAFQTLHFEARAIKHQDVVESWRILTKGA
ncbi:MAG: hypothetical protein IJH77_03395 [Mogibacterium sp.]|nr:hypothetical protein [Mogibacterium sp.]